MCRKEYEDWDTKAYIVHTVGGKGRVPMLKALGVDTITSRLEPVNVGGLMHMCKAKLE